MKLGTPLTATATKVMLLGSGELGKEVIIALQRYGIEVIAVDRYANAPGHQVAHRSYVIDMSNKSELRALILEVKPDIIIPEIEAIATKVLLDIEREKIAEVIPTARAVNLTMNREGIRDLAAKTLNIPTSKYLYADNLEELQQAIKSTIGLPCIIKPIMSSSGKGQSLINTEEDIDAAWKYALSGGRVRKNRVIVEQKIEFDYEITLLTVRALNASAKIETYFCDPIGHIQKNGDYVESWQPQQMDNKVLIKAQELAKTITTELGGRGVFGVEFFIKGEDVFFSEVSPRPHDTGTVTMISQVQNEFELHARAILGLPVSTDMIQPGASAVIYGAMDEVGICYTGLDQALTIPQTDVRLFGKPEAFTHRRMGVALAYAQDTQRARENAKKAASLIQPTKA